MARAKALAGPFTDDKDKRTAFQAKAILADAELVGKPPLAFSRKDDAGGEFSLDRYKGNYFFLDPLFPCWIKKKGA